MLYSNVMSSEKPEAITIENLPGGERRVILSRNFEEFEDEDGNGWRGEQAVFVMDPGRTESADEISADFDKWWEYAAAYRRNRPNPTLESRVGDLETDSAEMREALDMILSGVTE